MPTLTASAEPTTIEVVGGAGQAGDHVGRPSVGTDAERRTDPGEQQGDPAPVAIAGCS
jgi:hypothetical protein